MKKSYRQIRWKLPVLFIWILFLAAAGIGCYFLQRANVCKKAKTELTDQAEIISNQFSSLVNTNFYTRGVFYDRLISEVKAISVWISLP